MLVVFICVNNIIHGGKLLIRANLFELLASRINFDNILHYSLYDSGTFILQKVVGKT